MSVHFNEESMSTILSMKDVANVPGIIIHIDSDVYTVISIFLKERLVKFKECKDGLYFLTRKTKGYHIKIINLFFLLFCLTNNS